MTRQRKHGRVQTGILRWRPKYEFAYLGPDNPMVYMGYIQVSFVAWDGMSLNMVTYYLYDFTNQEVMAVQ